MVIARRLRLSVDAIQERADALTCQHRDAYDLRVTGVACMVERAQGNVVMGIIGWCRGHRAMHHGKTPAPCICGECENVQSVMPLAAELLDEQGATK